MEQDVEMCVHDIKNKFFLSFLIRVFTFYT